MAIQHTPWNQVMPIPQSWPYLASEQVSEVVVIGGGITGALCAWHLCQGGHDVTLITRGLVGMGGTCASLGIACAQAGESMGAHTREVGGDAALEAYRSAQGAISSIARIVEGQEEECGFSRRHLMTFAQDERDAVALYRTFKGLMHAGFNVEWVDRRGARSMLSFPVEGAILSAAAGAQADPYRLTHALLREAVQLGLRVYENTNVEVVRQRPREVLLRTQHNCALRARHVVVATGEPPARYRRHLLSWRSEALCTLPVAQINGWPQQAILQSYDGDTTLRMVEDRLLIGELRFPFPHGGYGSERRSRRLMGSLKTLFPQMAEGLSVGYHFGAQQYSTKDALPLIGQLPDSPGIYVVCGYGDNGISAGVIAGRLLLSWLRGERPPLGRLYRPERILPQKKAEKSHDS